MTRPDFNPETLTEAQRSLVARLGERFKPDGGNARINEVIGIWNAGAHLNFDDAREAFEALLSENATPYQTGIFLVMGAPDFLAADELAGFAASLRDKAEPIRLNPPNGSPAPILLDTCGTGGDTIPTFNISTTIMFIAAAEGIRVAKHGNRAFTSRSGSSDVLQALGINVALDPEGVRRCIEEVGAGFMFAPNFHKATKKVAEVRGVLAEPLPDGSKFKTMFNLLGPLSNPARTPLQSLGVYAPAILEKEANALARLGHVRRAVVVHGHGPKHDPAFGGRGLDEFSTVGDSEVVEIAHGVLRRSLIQPEEHFGLPRARAEELAGGDAAANAEIIRGILSGEVAGPKLDIVLANAAMALALAEPGTKFITDQPGLLRDRLELARESIASGRALRKLEQLRDCSART